LTLDKCGINANQLSRWVREHSQRRERAVAVSPVSGGAFVAVAIESSEPRRTGTNDSAAVVRMCLQARLPNGVVVDLRECDLRQATEVIEALGRVRCSASTKP